MKRILWVSRHPVLASQLKALKELFGDVSVDILFQRSNAQYLIQYLSAEDIVASMKEGEYDEVVVVAPLSVIAKLCELGVKPLWAEMEQVPPEQAETEANGRYYRFKRFRRIKGIKIEFEDFGEKTDEKV
ncbi:MAG: hypothetical protein JTT12_05665 [Candidatus Brockarchaeota archaeon]|nr:hypothetical protein [Candidatus Brockarchaeota archaeon]